MSRHAAMVAYRYLITGRVQGVGYRYFAMREAHALGVTGFARNLPDGGVEVVAEGSESALAQFEARLREGPGFARVEGLDRTLATPRGDQTFYVR